MNRNLFTLALLLSIMGCARLPLVHQENLPSAKPIALFSSGSPCALPAEWVPLVIFHSKKQTQYQLVREHEATVLHAYAEEASSGLMHHVSIDPLSRPWLSWSWKIGNAVEIAIAQQVVEDSPARIVLGFDGDKDTLSFSEQVLFETARIFTGHDFPYATLMYIWDKNAPVGTIMSSRRSSRIKMLVVANSADGIGKWQAFARNIAKDFEKAYGEKPGKLIGVGVLTDTDNLGETAEAWYGDIRLQPEQNNKLPQPNPTQSDLASTPTMQNSPASGCVARE